MKWILACLPLALTLVACEREPENYDDCILKHVKEGMDKAAVSAIVDSCYNKYEAFKCNMKKYGRDQLPEVRLISGELFAESKHLDFIIHNGSKLYVRKIEVSINAPDLPTPIVRELIINQRSESVIAPMDQAEGRLDLPVVDDYGKLALDIISVEAGICSK